MGCDIAAVETRVCAGEILNHPNDTETIFGWAMSTAICPSQPHRNDPNDVDRGNSDVRPPAEIGQS